MLADLRPTEGNGSGYQSSDEEKHQSRYGGTQHHMIAICPVQTVAREVVARKEPLAPKRWYEKQSQSHLRLSINLRRRPSCLHPGKCAHSARPGAARQFDGRRRFFVRIWSSNSDSLRTRSRMAALRNSSSALT